MIGNTEISTENCTDNNVELSIGKACEDYNDSVRFALFNINHQLDEFLLKNTNELDELCVKIAARANFLENNPSFLSCLVYNKTTINDKPLLEFDEIKITLKEHSRRVQEKLIEIEKYHTKIFQLVKSHGRDNEDTKPNAVKEQEEDFQDCFDKDIPQIKNAEVQESLHEIEKKKSTHLNFIRPTKPTHSFDRVTIESNAFSDLSLDSAPVNPPVKFQIFPDVLPDVQRRRPQEDLHGKLVQQVVATDSLEGFLKLMDRKPTTPKRKTTKKELEEKYAGSLYFFPKEVKKKTSKSSSCTKPTSRKLSKSSTTSGSTCCSLLVTSSQPCPMSNQDRTKKIRQSLNRHKLKCYDLLDDIDNNDLKPIKSEYPRRDNLYPKKLKEAKSYLHRMMQENEKVWKKLLQPVEMKKKTQPIEVKKNQSHHERKKLQPKVKQAKNLMEYLTAPEQKILSHIPQSLIVMPVKIIYDNFPTKDNVETPGGAVLITDLSKVAEPTRIEGKVLQTKRDSSPIPAHKKKEMLDQIKGLKMRNDNIQKNIHKAIDVIETKMIDLLSSPTDAANSEAFNAMEKEITTVLNMMNEHEQKEEKEKGVNEKKVKVDRKYEKTEAEKETSTPGANTSKMKQRTTIAKKSPASEAKVEVGDHLTETMKRDKSRDRKKIEDKPLTKCAGEDKKMNEVPKKSARDDYPKNKDVGVMITPKNLEVKRAANIEEGERLLNQVDNVIKKIDNIYTKLYDDGKSKTMSKREIYSSVAELFEGLKPPSESSFNIYYKYSEVPQMYQKSQVFNQTEIYYQTEFIPGLSPPIEEMVFFKPLDTIPPKEEFVDASDKIETKEQNVKDFTPRKEIVRFDQDPHDYTLKSFYTLFFTSIFIALNIDCAS